MKCAYFILVTISHKDSVYCTTGQYNLQNNHSICGLSLFKHDVVHVCICKHFLVV